MWEQGKRAIQVLALVLAIAASFAPGAAGAAELRDSERAAPTVEQAPVLLFLLTVLLSTPRTMSADAAGMMSDPASPERVGCCVETPKPPQLGCAAAATATC